ncbi:TonB-dependent receptor [Maricaulis maris]|uniref:TonB-dependent receptor n=1 Tax=Maricaulis maris TaxID=74318 RepID=A0A495CYG5_9PROT|nr:TonB-dependent receptor [Maricaulis maris]RKQ94233.1 TonB-dependent receptor [Maricaulis maris]
MKKTIAMLGTASVLALAAATAAQAGTIAGRVTDASESVGLEGAIVRIMETGQTTTVGADGTFRVTGLAAGDYTLRVSYVGAPAREYNVTLATVTDTVSPTITLGDDVEYMDNILVMGQRGALNSALSRQRANDGNVAVLSSDAIGQFPDENVAEAARRAVGVNVLNDQGEGRFVSIRGLDPNLVSTSINGVRLVSPEAEDRQVGLDVIDADVLSSVVINKSLLPNMDGDSIGGNVEIETMSGLDVDDMYLRARVAGLYSDMEQEFGHRGSINFANNFMDGRLGVAGSLSYQQRVFGSDSFEVDGGWDVDESVAFPNEVEMRNYQVTRERTTAALNFDYRVNNDLTLYSRSTWSDFSDAEYRNRVEIKFEDAEYDDTNSSGNLAVFTADEMEIDRDIKDRLETQMIFATDFGGEWLNGNTSVDWSLSYVYAEEAEPNRLDTDFSYEFEDGELFTVDSTNPLRPQLGFAGGVTTDRVFDASNYENAGFELTNGLSQDREYAAALNIRHDMNFGTMPGYVQYGVRARTRDKKFALDFDVYDDANLLLSEVVRTVDYGQGPIGPVANPASVRDFFFSNLGSLDYAANDSDIDSFGASYRVEEDVMAGYLMGSIENGPLRLVGGVRVEQTDMAARGYETFLAEEDSTVNGVVQLEDTVYVTPTSASDDYTDVLPSILARYELTENVIVRGGYFASIQRPNPGQFAPRILVEQNDDDEVEGEFGNPDLERLEAENFDVSIEWYPNNDAVVYLGYFNKDLENVIAGVGYEDITLNGRFFDEAASFINLPNAEVSGLEFNYQQALDFLPVEGFIVGFNYTATDSEAVLPDGRIVPLPRQSDTVWNAVLGYDNGPWDLRAVLSTRSEFLDEIRGGADEDRWVLEHSQLDLSAKFEFNDTLQIFADLKNVTDEPFRAVTRPDGIDRVEQFEEYGWSAVFGVRVTY